MRLIAETERLIIREMDSATDAEFILALLNSPKFIKYIGDRNVRSVEAAAAFIDERYRQSYSDHGFGLYTVVQRSSSEPIGMCGFVKRDHLEFPDIGFAFLPEFEGKGYGFASANAVLRYARETLGFRHVLAITSQDNHASGHLLEKLGFLFEGVSPMPEGDLNLYNKDLFD